MNACEPPMLPANMLIVLRRIHVARNMHVCTCIWPYFQVCVCVYFPYTNLRLRLSLLGLECGFGGVGETAVTDGWRLNIRGR